MMHKYMVGVLLVFASMLVMADDYYEMKTLAAAKDIEIAVMASPKLAKYGVNAKTGVVATNKQVLLGFSEIILRDGKYWIQAPPTNWGIVIVGTKTNLTQKQVEQLKTNTIVAVQL